MDINAVNLAVQTVERKMKDPSSSMRGPLNDTFAKPTALAKRLTDTGRGAVVLTIDDAFAHMRTMAEMMNARGQRGTFCITPGLMGGAGKIVDADVVYLDQTGHEVAAHSKTHANMTSLTSAQRVEEYDYPKTYLENLIGAGKVTTWCYPFGTGSGGRNLATDQQLYLRYERLLDTANNTNPVVYPRYSDAPPYLVNRIAWSSENHNSVMQTVARAAVSPVLVPIFFHNVDTAVNPTMAQFTALLDYCQANNIPMITVKEGFGSVTTLLNPGFEGTNPDNVVSPWRQFIGTNGTIGVIADTPASDYQGTQSLRLMTTDNTGFAYVRQQVQVIPGRQYTLSGQCKAVTGANLIADKAYVRITPLDYGQAVIAGAEVKATVLLTADTGTGWKKFTLDYTAGQTAKTVNVDLVLASAVGGADIRFDHVWFEPKYLGDLG